jgi:hypothetical protein
VRDFRKPNRGLWKRYLVAGIALVITIQGILLAVSDSDVDTAPPKAEERQQRR